MTWQDASLIVAGVIGCGVALVHGRLTERLMVKPLVTGSLSDGSVSGVIRKLVPPLLQFSTFNWFTGGLALIAAALWLGQEARLVVGLLVGSSYLYGAVCALWATRGRHPGWALYAIALGLIAYGVCGDGGPSA